MKNAFVAFCLLFLSTYFSFGQRDPYLKKLGVYSKRWTMNDTVVVTKLNETAKDTLYSNSTKALLYSRTAYNISKSLEYDEGAAASLLNMSRSKIYLNDFDSALYFANESLRLAKKTHSAIAIVRAYEMKGNVYVYTEEYDKAIKEYLLAIKKGEGSLERNILSAYSNIGLVFLRTENKPKAMEYCQMSLDLGRKYHDSAIVVSALNNLGLLVQNDPDKSKSKKYFEEGLKIARATNNENRIAEILYNLSNVYFKEKNYKKGYELFEESLEISKVNGSYSSIAISYHAMAFNYYEIDRLEDAEIAAKKAIEYALLSKSYGIIIESYSAMAEILKAKGDGEGAFDNLASAFMYKDSLKLAELNSSVSQAENKYENEKKTLKAELLRANDKKINDEKLKSREILLWISGIALIVFFIGIYFLLKNNKLIKAKNITVEKQKNEIEIQHQEIKDSITYAKRIQTALISGKDGWKTISKDVSVFFRPKDVVSGDFYWMHHNEEKNISIWAVGDCTGHGVPGAFMSMLGIGYLNEIVVENSVIDPGEILNALRSRIISALANEESESKDGMDIGICVWDKNKNVVLFAGANNGMWLMRERAQLEPALFKTVYDNPTETKVIAEIPADKMPIGKLFAVPPPFSTQQVKVLPGDQVVLFTDGYADQFGGDSDKKFKYRPLKDLMLKLSQHPFESHEAELEKTFNKWKGKNEQTDDVCIVLLKIGS